MKLSQINPDKITFMPVISNPKVKFLNKRIPIKYDNDKDLVFTLDKLFSFGVRPIIGVDDKYTLSVSMWTNQGNPTEQDKQNISAIHSITDKCIAYLVNHFQNMNKEELNNPRGGLNPLYFKTVLNEKGKYVVDKETAPVLQSKLYYTKFFSALTNELIKDSPDTLNYFFPCKVAIKVDSIYIGKTVSLQLKLIECLVYPKVEPRSRLLTADDDDDDEIE